MNNALRVGGVQRIGNLDTQRQQNIQLHRTIADNMFQRRSRQGTP